VPDNTGGTLIPSQSGARPEPLPDPWIEYARFTPGGVMAREEKDRHEVAPLSGLSEKFNGTHACAPCTSVTGLGPWPGSAIPMNTSFVSTPRTVPPDRSVPTTVGNPDNVHVAAPVFVISMTSSEFPPAALAPSDLTANCAAVQVAVAGVWDATGEEGDEGAPDAGADVDVDADGDVVLVHAVVHAIQRAMMVKPTGMVP
jgi:hypothetical protein